MPPVGAQMEAVEALEAEEMDLSEPPLSSIMKRALSKSAWLPVNRPMSYLDTKTRWNIWIGRLLDRRDHVLPHILRKVSK